MQGKLWIFQLEKAYSLQVRKFAKVELICKLKTTNFYFNKNNVPVFGIFF